MIVNLGDTYFEVQKYTITHNLSNRGISVDKETAVAGETVTVTISMDWFHTSLYMTYDNITVLLTSNPEGGSTATFSMPESNVELIEAA